MKNDFRSFSFLRKKYKYLSFSNSFCTFSLIIIFIELIFSFFIYSYLNYSHLSRLKTQTITESNRIENSLKDIFTETHQIMVYVGKQISSHGYNNPQFIEKLLINSAETLSKIKTIYSWSLFEWVDSNNLITVNSHIGIVPNSLEKVRDSYTWKCPQFPWTLQLSHPAIGNTSGMWVIPAGMGITDEKNLYLGTLNVAFNIAELNHKIQQTLTSKEISFVVLDNDFKIILQSSDNLIDPKSSYYRDVLAHKKYIKEDDGYFESPIFYHDIQYSHYKKLEDYPYTILIGFNKNIAQSMLWDLILPRLLELYGLGLFCLGLLYFLRRKIFNLTQSSDIAKENLFRRLNVRMKESISSILTYSNLLTQSYTKDTKILLTPDRQTRFIKKIYQEALNLYTMTSHSLPSDFIDIKDLIESAVELQMKTFLKKNINIKIHLPSSLLPFYGDELSLKQIILGLLFLATEYSPKGSTITISAENETNKNDQKFLLITVEDNGFCLTAEDIKRLSDNFSNTSSKKDFIENYLEFPNIEELVKLYDGTCIISNKEENGKIIKVTLPYPKDDPTKDNIESSNIYRFPKTSKLNH